MVFQIGRRPLLALLVLRAAFACTPMENQQSPSVDPCLNSGCPASGRPFNSVNSVPAGINNVGLESIVDSCYSITFTCRDPNAATGVAIVSDPVSAHPVTGGGPVFCDSVPTTGNRCSATFRCADGIWTGQPVLPPGSPQQTVTGLHCVSK